MLSVIKLNATYKPFVLSVVSLNVVMLSVVVPPGVCAIKLFTTVIDISQTHSPQSKFVGKNGNITLMIGSSHCSRILDLGGSAGHGNHKKCSINW
jgi:hypothetical protein